MLGVLLCGYGKIFEIKVYNYCVRRYIVQCSNGRLDVGQRHQGKKENWSFMHTMPFPSRNFSSAHVVLSSSKSATTFNYKFNCQWCLFRLAFIQNTSLWVLISSIKKLRDFFYSIKQTLRLIVFS